MMKSKERLAIVADAVVVYIFQHNGGSIDAIVEYE